MKVVIDGVEYTPKERPIDEPFNRPGGATHWAVCPDGQILFYQITNNEILLYINKPWDIWHKPGNAPYTLYCFDNYDDFK